MKQYEKNGIIYYYDRHYKMWVIFFEETTEYEYTKKDAEETIEYFTRKEQQQ